MREKQNDKNCYACFIFTAVLIVVLLKSILAKSYSSNAYLQKDYPIDSYSVNNYSVSDINFSRVSKKKIKISWHDIKDEHINCYIVRRRSISDNKEKGKWKIIDTLKPVSNNAAKKLSVIDCLKKSEPQQYEYRVDTKIINDGQTILAKGKTIFASNIMVCIDAGHYKNKNQVLGKSSYGYAEGNFTLKIALELKKILKKAYGIDAYMTRDSGDIKLEGYVNLELDSSHISLRGKYAAKKKSNLFVSLHTNANGDNANGYETCMQPISINKSIIIANTIVCASVSNIEMCNYIGTNLSKVNAGLKLSSSDKFKTVKKNKITEWTDKYNDGLNLAGTVVRRYGSSGDYYGVLRGAAEEGIAGIIIEHGFHTVPAVRKAAKEGKLEAYWAWADAYGIAEGFDFAGNTENFLIKKFL